ncbi:MAG: hypothetical protein AUG03_07345 [Acidobacteria bacterium 13_1_20CM_2_68_14]|nr:MAG: hypothetical protein AUG03_07345 [Acidobacteria bacterium 13_1_20CM_2_68_14]
MLAAGGVSVIRAVTPVTAGAVLCVGTIGVLNRFGLSERFASDPEATLLELRHPSPGWLFATLSIGVVD